MACLLTDNNEYRHKGTGRPHLQEEFFSFFPQKNKEKKEMLYIFIIE